MSNQPELIALQRPRRHGNAFLFACLTLLLWYVVLTIFLPTAIYDETFHFPVIERTAHGRWTLAPEVPMLPGYHFMAAALSCALGIHLSIARALSTVLAVLSAWLLLQAERRIRPDQAGRRMLLMVWLPVFFPVACMAYTESAALFFMVLALGLHLRRRWMWSGLALFLACLIRQPNIVWVVFFALGSLLDGHPAGHLPLDPAPRGPARLISRVGVHAIVLAAAVLFFVHRGEIGIGDHPNNVARLNIAQFFVYACFLLVMWAPIWGDRVGDDIRAFLSWAARNPRPAAACGVACVVAVWGLARLYGNPNSWNSRGELQFIRNWPLAAMDAYPPLRIIGATVVVSIAAMMVRFIATQPNRRMLTLAWIFGLAFLAPHFLVEPRYYIMPLFMLNFFAHFTPNQLRRLALWYGGLSLFSCILIMSGHDW